MGELIWGFHTPHRIGSLCFKRCEQCPKDTVGVDTHGNFLWDRPPLLILREATRAEWAASVRANGGYAIDSDSCPYSHFYAVTTD
jgi:hypothetical protein